MKNDQEIEKALWLMASMPPEIFDRLSEKESLFFEGAAKALSWVLGLAYADAERFQEIVNQLGEYTRLIDQEKTLPDGEDLFDIHGL